jgi:hypothetical protein
MNFLKSKVKSTYVHIKGFPYYSFSFCSVLNENNIHKEENKNLKIKVNQINKPSVIYFSIENYTDKTEKTKIITTKQKRVNKVLLISMSYCSLLKNYF